MPIGFLSTFALSSQKKRFKNCLSHDSW